MILFPILLVLQVFQGVVKIRKGMAVKMILDTADTSGLHKWFYLLATDILSRIPHDDPNAMDTKNICQVIIELTKKEGKKSLMVSYLNAYITIALIIWFVSALSLAAVLEVKTWPNMSNVTEMMLVVISGSSAVIMLVCAVLKTGLSVTCAQKKNKKSIKRD